MYKLSSITAMTEQGFDQDRQISEIVAEERFRLRNFIRRRVPDPADVEDILQEVFYELTRLMIIAPLAIMGIVVFTAIGGEVVMLLWNWLAPTLFGLRLITFWQAIGLLALCRILFGGFGLGGGGHRNSRRRMEGRIRERVRERMDERREQMTTEEREKFRQGMRGCGGQTTPLDSNPSG